MSSLLVRIFGWKAALHHGDALVWDRWRWIERRLRLTHNNEKLLDVGCGSGAFSIGAAKRGYKALGLSWDKRNKAVAIERAQISGALTASFEICDVRNLDERVEYREQFDVVICTENIEHIIDDFRLIKAIHDCLKPGGRLLLTTPHLERVPQDYMDYGPFPSIEDGRHVRRGYNKVMLQELFDIAGLKVEGFSYISGPISQLQAYLQRQIGRIHPKLGWGATLPMRIFPPLLDPMLTKVFKFAPFSIGCEAYKPRAKK